MPLYLKFYIWLLVISVTVFALERCFTARPSQPVIRDGFGQDLFWLVFNTQYLSWMLAVVAVYFVGWLNSAFFHLGVAQPDSLNLLATWPVWVQAVVFFVIKDFLEWNIHRTLHRVSWLWELHKLHHSSTQLDWLATFRSHWGEIIIYKLIIYLPLVALGVDDRAIFTILVVSLFMQELVHANLNWDWGPLRYFINSPRLHAWHHSVEMHGTGGQNFGINLALWDWLFRTAYWPADGHAPGELGFTGGNEYPAGVWQRFWAPFVRRRARKSEHKKAA